MGQKVSPISFRLGRLTDWYSRWFADKSYRKFLLEDLKIRDFILKKLPNYYISKIDIERGRNVLEVTIHSARPGMIIGRSGALVSSLKQQLSHLTTGDLKINISEVKEPNLSARLVAYNIAQQIEKRVSYKRAMKQAVSNVMEAGAKGVKIICKGRLAGAEIARSSSASAGRMPLGTIDANIDFAKAEAKTTYGIIGVKVWIYVDAKKA